jgi:hypothetical protein
MPRRPNSVTVVRMEFLTGTGRSSDGPHVTAAHRPRSSPWPLPLCRVSYSPSAGPREEAVNDDDCRQRHRGGQQHRGPVHGVEPNDVPANHVDAIHCNAVAPISTGPSPKNERRSEFARIRCRSPDQGHPEPGCTVHSIPIRVSEQMPIDTLSSTRGQHRHTRERDAKVRDGDISVMTIRECRSS